MLQNSSLVQLDYWFLYAKQAGQVVRGDRSGTEFNCIVGTYSEHQVGVFPVLK